MATEDPESVRKGLCHSCTEGIEPNDKSHAKAGRTQKIDVAMFEVTNGVVETTLYAQDVGEPTWKKYPEFKYTIKEAYFPVMDFPFKDLHFPLDSWVIWPCGVQEKKDGSRREVFAALKVIPRQPPNMASHGTGYARP